MGSRGNGAAVVSFIVVLLAAIHVTCGSAVVDVRLGFLLPFPEGDSAVPTRLADEWISAARIALDVLGRRFSHVVRVKPFIANSNCDSAAAFESAQRLVDDMVVGVVGPACSEAVKGASQALRPEHIPMVSFAATADAFSGDLYSTFFRTVYSDRFQALAINDVLTRFRWENIYIIYSDEAYGRNLMEDIQQLARTHALGVVPIRVPFPPPSDLRPFLRLNRRLLSANESTVVVMAALPNVVEGVWRAAKEMDLLHYPWWYLVSDGGTAFDLVGAGGDTVRMGSYLQGELGISPFRGQGDTDAASPFEQFRAYWQQQHYSSYPGLLTLPASPRFNQPRAYVLHLIDAVWAFFKAFENILVVQRQSDVTPRLVLEVFRNVSGQSVHFTGVTGPVSFNPNTGDRNEEAKRATFMLTSLIGVGWQDVAPWHHLGGGDGFVLPDIIRRPGPVPAGVDLPQGQVAAQPFTVPEEMQGEESSAYSSGNGTLTEMTQWVVETTRNPSNTGIVVVGALLLVLLLVAVVWAVVWRAGRKRRHPDHNQFARMI